MRNQNNQRGFTLTELIVVIAVLLILVAIIIPWLIGYIAHAETAADTANQRLLNTTTIIYRIYNPPPVFDPFDHLEASDNQRIQALVDADLLPTPVSTRRRGTRFRWDHGEQTWQYEKDESTEHPTLPSETSEPGESEPTPTEPSPELPEWNSGETYLGGTRVLYNGRIFEARHWTQGLQPGEVGHPWQEITNEWRNYNVYMSGSQVIHNGITYTARNWSENQQPGMVGHPWQELTDQWRIHNRYVGGDIVWYNGQRYRAKWVRDPGADSSPASSNAWTALD
jgi:prepilin-type N-terminal cleavage/methylation domain-containing protein